MISRSLATSVAGPPAILALVLAMALLAARAADHREALALSVRPQVDLTDVYAFVGLRSNDPSTEVLTIIAAFAPYSEAGSAAIKNRVDGNRIYQIHIDDPVIRR